MWKWSSKTPHTQFLCRVQFHKLPLKTHRGLKFHNAKSQKAIFSLFSCGNFFLSLLFYYIKKLKTYKKFENIIVGWNCTTYTRFSWSDLRSNKIVNQNQDRGWIRDGPRCPKQLSLKSDLMLPWTKLSKVCVLERRSISGLVLMNISWSNVVYVFETY